MATPCHARDVCRYDEWVAGDRIVGDHEEGKELQRSLKESAERNQKEQAARKKSAKARKATFDKKVRRSDDFTRVGVGVCVS